jgi:hypothetical protein
VAQRAREEGDRATREAAQREAEEGVCGGRGGAGGVRLRGGGGGGRAAAAGGPARARRRRCRSLSRRWRAGCASSRHRLAARPSPSPPCRCPLPPAAAAARAAGTAIVDRIAPRRAGKLGCGPGPDREPGAGAGHGRGGYRARIRVRARAWPPGTRTRAVRHSDCPTHELGVTGPHDSPAGPARVGGVTSVTAFRCQSREAALSQTVSYDGPAPS